MDNFIDELLQEVEEKEQKLLASHADLLLNEIGSLQRQIDTNFTQADEEKRIIHEWALSRNSKLQDRISWLERKLEAFMKEQGPNVKTVDLPNGKLLRRKQQTKVEITDMEEFMKNEKLYQLGTIQPEIIKPNLNMIKAFINMTSKVPKGVVVTEGKEKFSIKLKQHGEENGKKETGTRTEQTNNLKAVIDAKRNTFKKNYGNALQIKRYEIEDEKDNCLKKVSEKLYKIKTKKLNFRKWQNRKIYWEKKISKDFVF